MGASMEYVVERGMRWLPESSWRPVMQRSIDAFYEGKPDEGVAACRTLLNAVGLPDEIRNLTYQNQTYYARPLTELIPGAAWQPLPMPVPAGWVARDPSPAARDERLLVLVRAAPATEPVESGEEAGAAIPEGMEIVVLRDEDRGGPRLSEARPFFAGEAIQVAAVVREPGEGVRDRAGVVTLTEGKAGEPRLLEPRPGNFRGGWSPLLTDAGPRFIGWWEPTEVFRLDDATGEFARVALRMAPHLAERFQGGSQGVPVPGGYLLLVNETVTMGDGNAVTLSRFVRVDEGFQITDVSPQFYLGERGRDVATGLARQGERLIAAFTANGRSALATMDLAPVLDLDDRPGPSATNPDGTRSYGIDPDVAADDGVAFARGLRAAGVVPVVKH
ncbi:MAG TPA: hypothetical protein VFI12_06800, partial [Thermomicrobiales bacterium]|nr:hypothetical protein [Thermomicrobiales bacterium]